MDADGRSVAAAEAVAAPLDGSGRLRPRSLEDDAAVALLTAGATGRLAAAWLAAAT